MANVCPTCGHKTTSIRSIDQHRRYFGVIKAAFHHWPEQHDKQFSSEHELRIWLQMKAGAREVSARIPLVGAPKEIVQMLVAQALKAAKADAVPSLHKDELIIWVPTSIAFGNLGHLKFCELNNAVDEVLKTEIGLSGDDLLINTAAAA